jgi:cell division protein FtsB
MTCALSVDTVSESAHSTAGIMAGGDGALQKEIKTLGARVQQIERAMREMRDNVEIKM